jgi:hypothetical protein
MLYAATPCPALAAAALALATYSCSLTARSPCCSGAALLQQDAAHAAASSPFSLPLIGGAPDLEALLAPGALVRNPGVGWAVNNRQRQLFYPAWMAGTWQVGLLLRTERVLLGPQAHSRCAPLQAQQAGLTSGTCSCPRAGAQHPFTEHHAQPVGLQQRQQQLLMLTLCIAATPSSSSS